MEILIPFLILILALVVTGALLYTTNQRDIKDRPPPVNYEELLATEEGREYLKYLNDVRKKGDPFYPIPRDDGSVYIGTMYGGESTQVTFHSKR